MIVALFGLLMPRFIMVLLWLFSDYLSEAYGTWVWPLIGFFILPTTTLCYAVAVHELTGSPDGARRSRSSACWSTWACWVAAEGYSRAHATPCEGARASWDPAACAEPHRDPW